MRDLLGGGHRAFSRRESRVLFLQVAGRAVEELMNGLQLHQPLFGK
ncbi:MAG: hypothetical protein AB1806_21095 [Acidobacteriota bacterium]